MIHEAPSNYRAGWREASGLYEPLSVVNFAGGGGACLGIERAQLRAVDIAINHDPAAIAMHRVNHPATRHLLEDVWHVNPLEVTAGRAVGVCWNSPDCRHFSKAKGDKPVDRGIRGLAWIAVKWGKLKRPLVIFLENVREFQDWGPLTRKNRPNKRLKGQTFRRFVRSLERLGYVVEWRVLNAADYGEPTHRRRLFMIARCDGAPIRWPEPTHGPGRAKPYRTAAECIDWSIPCPSIFERTRPLADKTMRRIAMGLWRYVLNNPKPYIVNIERSYKPWAGGAIDAPLGTITAQPKGGKHAVVMPSIVQVNHGDDLFRGQAMDQPMPTISAKHGFGVVAPTIVRCAHGDGEGKTARRGHGEHSLEQPLPTVTGSKDFAVSTPMLVKYHSEKGGETLVNPADEPMRTLDASNRFGLASATLIQTGYGEREGQEPRVPGIEKPLGTVVSGQKHALVSAFLSQYFGGVVGKAVTEPVPTVTAIDHNAVVGATLVGVGGADYAGKPRPVDDPKSTVLPHDRTALATAHIVKFRGDSKGSSVEAPLPTITAGAGAERPAGAPHALGLATYVVRNFHSAGGRQSQAPDEPLGTVTGQTNKFDLAAATITRFNHGDKQWHDVDAPLGTATAGAGGGHFGLVYAFLVKYFGNIATLGQKIDEPMHTQTGKHRFGLVQIEIAPGKLEPAVSIDVPGVGPCLIADIGLRMLQPRELARAQGFPDTYILTGSKANQVAKIGNSVPPKLAEVLVAANTERP